MAANFALSPAHANANQVINFTTAGGAKFYKQAIRGLYDSGDLYDLEADGLKTFLDTLQDRIVEQNWTSIFATPKCRECPCGPKCFAPYGHFLSNFHRWPLSE